MPNLPELENGLALPIPLIRGGRQALGPADAVRVGLADLPTAPDNDAQTILDYLLGEAHLALSRLDEIAAQLSAFTFTLPADEWQTITAGVSTRRGVAGLAFLSHDAARTAATAFNAETQWALGSTIHDTDWNVVLELSEDLDVGRYRMVLSNVALAGGVTLWPGAQTQWVKMTNVSNGRADRDYYLMMDGNAVEIVRFTEATSPLVLQRNHGDYSSFALPDSFVTPEMLRIRAGGQGGTDAAAFRTRIGAYALTASTILAQHLDTTDATKQAAFRSAIGIVTSQGHTISDDSILPAWLQADTEPQAMAFRERIGAAKRPTEISITWGHADNAAGTTPRGSTGIDVPLDAYFVLRGVEARNRDYRFITLPENHRLSSVIGEGGEILDDWDIQADARTYSIGPLGSRGSDAETFAFYAEVNP